MHTKPKFPKRLRVMAEYGSSGIWVAEAVGPFRHGMIAAKRLGLPAELSARFAAWIERYWARLKDGFDVDAFNAEGRALAAELKVFVGADTEVVFEAEGADGGLVPPVIIETQ